MGAIYALIARALASAPVALLATAAGKVGSLIGRVVPASAVGIAQAIRGWAGRNPGKIALALSTLTSVGIDIAADKIKEAFDADGIDDNAANAVIEDMRKRIHDDRQRMTGDGEVKTAHGFTNEQYEDVLARNSVVTDIIEDALTHTGSLEALKAIRAAIFLEDVDFDLYSRYNKG